jgi:hypothetical protein
VRCEASRHFGNKKGEYLEGKISEFAMNTKNKSIRDMYGGINEFKRNYQPRNNLVRDENGDLLADLNNNVSRWKSYFHQILNVHNVSDVRKIEVHTAEPQVLGSSHLEDEIAVAELK